MLYLFTKLCYNIKKREDVKKIMKRIFCFVLTLFIIGLAFTACSEPLSDNPAPDFSVKDINGESVSLSDFFGKPIVVNFWGTWCPWCIKEFPEFQKVYEELGKEVQFLMVNYGDTMNDIDEFLTANPEYTFPIYIDFKGVAVDTYQVKGFPTTVFIHSNGEVSDIRSGALSEATLRECIAEIFAKK